MQPLLPHSWIFGHLIVVAKSMAKYPRDTNPHYLPFVLAKEYPDAGLLEPGLIYLDTWPISPPMIQVFHPDMMAQFMQETVLAKHPVMKGEFGPFTNLKDLLNMEGKEWKKWRAIFSPGFSVKNILMLVPHFLEEIDVFVSSLGEASESGKVISMERKATMCTIDIIGRATLYVRTVLPPSCDSIES